MCPLCGKLFFKNVTDYICINRQFSNIEYAVANSRQGVVLRLRGPQQKPGTGNNLSNGKCTRYLKLAVCVHVPGSLHRLVEGRVMAFVNAAMNN
jgi:hypothetical protein